MWPTAVVGQRKFPFKWEISGYVFYEPQFFALGPSPGMGVGFARLRPACRGRAGRTLSPLVPPLTARMMPNIAVILPYRHFQAQIQIGAYVMLLADRLDAVGSIGFKSGLQSVAEPDYCLSGIPHFDFSRFQFAHRASNFDFQGLNFKVAHHQNLHQARTLDMLHKIADVVRRPRFIWEIPDEVPPFDPEAQS